jgi:hypothetical protein
MGRVPTMAPITGMATGTTVITDPTGATDTTAVTMDVDFTDATTVDGTVDPRLPSASGFRFSAAVVARDFHLDRRSR